MSLISGSHLFRAVYPIPPPPVRAASWAFNWLAMSPWLAMLLLERASRLGRTAHAKRPVCLAMHLSASYLGGGHGISSRSSVRLPQLRGEHLRSPSLAFRDNALGCGAAIPDRTSSE